LQWATADRNKDNNFKIFVHHSHSPEWGYWQQLACLSGVNSTYVLPIVVNTGVPPVSAGSTFQGKGLGFFYRLSHKKIRNSN
jgi:hypothetical protein